MRAARNCVFAIEPRVKVPAHWFDVQLAAGFVSTDYPASYARLVQRWLNRPAAKGETRTDWRRRPLTNAQIDYALSDVLHLVELRDVLRGELRQRGRVTWFEEESTIRVRREGPGAKSDGWRKLAGRQFLVATRPIDPGPYLGVA